MCLYYYELLSKSAYMVVFLMTMGVNNSRKGMKKQKDKIPKLYSYDWNQMITC